MLIECDITVMTDTTGIINSVVSLSLILFVPAVVYIAKIDVRGC